MNTADCHAGNGMLQAELEHPNHSMSQPYSYHCCTVSALMLRGRMRNTGVEMMLNSVACISLVREDTATRLTGLQSVSVHSVSNGRASARSCLLACPGRAHDHLGGVITPVILGINFVQTNGLILECTNTLVQITTSQP